MQGIPYYFPRLKYKRLSLLLRWCSACEFSTRRFLHPISCSRQQSQWEYIVLCSLITTTQQKDKDGLARCLVVVVAEKCWTPHRLPPFAQQVTLRWIFHASARPFRKVRTILCHLSPSFHLDSIPVLSRRRIPQKSPWGPFYGGARVLVSLFGYWDYCGYTCSVRLNPFNTCQQPNGTPTWPSWSCWSRRTYRDLFIWSLGIKP